eukprot:scaffold57078_cov39-Prasinocladus_malaysianus.AAC.2
METDAAYILAADLPGMDEENVTVRLDGRVLTISAGDNREHETNDDDGKDGDDKVRMLRVERQHHRSYQQRAFSLPKNVDSDAITASLDKGVLHVTLPKVIEKSSASRTIHIAGKNRQQQAAITGEASVPNGATNKVAV